MVLRLSPCTKWLSSGKCLLFDKVAGVSGVCLSCDDLRVSSLWESPKKFMDLFF